MPTTNKSQVHLKKNPLQKNKSTDLEGYERDYDETDGVLSEITFVIKQMVQGLAKQIKKSWSK